jgi:hypothetical protein
MKRLKALSVLWIIISSLTFCQQTEKDVQHVFVGRFISYECGDYCHIIFDTQSKNAPEFGLGKDELGEFNLSVENEFGEIEANKEYIGKTFKVTWAYVETSTYAGEGSTEVIERLVPTIIKLELASETK